MKNDSGRRRSDMLRSISYLHNIIIYYKSECLTDCLLSFVFYSIWSWSIKLITFSIKGISIDF